MGYSNSDLINNYLIIKLLGGSMKSFFKLFLLIAFLFLSSSDLVAQYTWTKYPGNPLNINGSIGSWNQSVLAPWVIFNPDSNRFEMWFTARSNYPNAGIGLAYSSNGINWTLHPTPVMKPSVTGWDSLFVGVSCVIKESGTYKMWYTGWKSSTRYPHSIGYATSPDGIHWTKHPENPVLSPLTGWESGAVGYPSVIKVDTSYFMFYTGEVSLGVALTGRAISSDGITWERYANNPVLPADVSAWDRNNYLARVIEMNDSLYLWYTAESNPGVSGTAIGFATSADTGKTWTKYLDNPVLTVGTTVSWDHGWIETGGILSIQRELNLYYDGGSSSTLGRIGLATSTIVSIEDETILPTEFVLEQNYPNPFNPSTTIKYSIPELSNVKLTLFNLLGEEVTTLVNEEKMAGNYSVEFNAANLPSGVYFYQLKAEEYISTKKMILMK
jgi:predicted GH43/DUF377 family glycosyl hydrolase